MSARFRLAHLSDLHFNANPRRVTSGLHAFLSWHDSAAVREAKAQLQALPAGDIDVLVVSGDLATSGDAADLALAEQFVRDLEALDSVTKVIVIPGNHDRYQSSGVAFYAPGNRAFENHFRDHRAFSATLLADVRRADCRLVAIGLDLCLNPADNSIRFQAHDQPGCGAAYDGVLKRATAFTSAVRTDGEPAPYVVWVCHFPPRSRHTLRLIDERVFLDEARLAGPNLVLFGHTHANSFANMGVHTVMGLVGASTTEFSKDPVKREKRAFSVLDVDVQPTGTGLVQVAHYHWDNVRATYC